MDFLSNIRDEPDLSFESELFSKIFLYCSSKISIPEKKKNEENNLSRKRKIEYDSNNQKRKKRKLEKTIEKTESLESLNKIIPIERQINIKDVFNEYLKKYNIDNISQHTMNEYNLKIEFETELIIVKREENKHLCILKNFFNVGLILITLQHKKPLWNTQIHHPKYNDYFIKSYINIMLDILIEFDLYNLYICIKELAKTQLDSFLDLSDQDSILENNFNLFKKNLILYFEIKLEKLEQIRRHNKIRRKHTISLLSVLAYIDAISELEDIVKMASGCYLFSNYITTILAAKDFKMARFKNGPLYAFDTQINVTNKTIQSRLQEVVNSKKEKVNLTCLIFSENQNLYLFDVIAINENLLDNVSWLDRLNYAKSIEKFKHIKLTPIEEKDIENFNTFYRYVLTCGVNTGTAFKFVNKLHRQNIEQNLSIQDKNESEEDFDSERDDDD